MTEECREALIAAEEKNDESSLIRLIGNDKYEIIQSGITKISLPMDIYSTLLSEIRLANAPMNEPSLLYGDALDIFGICAYRGLYRCVEHIATVFPEWISNYSTKLRSALTYAVIGDHPRIVQTILDNLPKNMFFTVDNVDVDEISTIEYSIKLHRTGIMKMLIDSGLIDIKDKLNAKGHNIMHQCVSYWNIVCAKHVLQIDPSLYYSKTLFGGTVAHSIYITYILTLHNFPFDSPSAKDFVTIFDSRDNGVSKLATDMLVFIMGRDAEIANVKDCLGQSLMSYLIQKGMVDSNPAFSNLIIRSDSTHNEDQVLLKCMADINCLGIKKMLKSINFDIIIIQKALALMLIFKRFDQFDHFLRSKFILAFISPDFENHLNEYLMAYQRIVRKTISLYSFMSFCVIYNYDELVLKLIAFQPELISFRTSNTKNTLLHYAAFNDKHNILRGLHPLIPSRLKKWLLNVPNVEGLSPIQLALTKSKDVDSRLTTVEILFETYDLKPYHRTTDGFSVLHYCAVSYYEVLFSVMVNYQGENYLDIRGPCGEYIFHFLSKENLAMVMGYTKRNQGYMSYLGNVRGNEAVTIAEFYSAEDTSKVINRAVESRSKSKAKLMNEVYMIQYDPAISCKVEDAGCQGCDTINDLLTGLLDMVIENETHAESTLQLEDEFNNLMSGVCDIVSQDEVVKDVFSGLFNPFQSSKVAKKAKPSSSDPKASIFNEDSLYELMVVEQSVLAARLKKKKLTKLQAKTLIDELEITESLNYTTLFVIFQAIDRSISFKYSFGVLKSNKNRPLDLENDNHVKLLKEMVKANLCTKKDVIQCLFESTLTPKKVINIADFLSSEDKQRIAKEFLTLNVEDEATLEAAYNLVNPNSNLQTDRKKLIDEMEAKKNTLARKQIDNAPTEKAKKVKVIRENQVAEPVEIVLSKNQKKKMAKKLAKSKQRKTQGSQGSSSSVANEDAPSETADANSDEQIYDDDSKMDYETAYDAVIHEEQLQEPLTIKEDEIEEVSETGKGKEVLLPAAFSFSSAASNFEFTFRRPCPRINLPMPPKTLRKANQPAYDSDYEDSDDDIEIIMKPFNVPDICHLKTHYGHDIYKLVHLFVRQYLHRPETFMPKESVEVLVNLLLEYYPILPDNMNINAPFLHSLIETAYKDCSRLFLPNIEVLSELKKAMKFFKSFIDQQ